jgi:hypothetical protein
MRIVVLALTVLCVILPAGQSWAGRMAFLDSVTGELKAHGFVEQNTPGDTAIAVADDFALEPHRWRWDGSAWQPFLAPPSAAEVDLADARQKLTDAATDNTIPPRVRAALDAIRRVLR